MALTIGMKSYSPGRALRGVRKAWKVARNAVWEPAERASDAYATHVPVLIALAHVLNVRRVIECGCGQYSTLTFLDRSAFPDLLELRSLENDAEWFTRIAEQVGDDERLEMIAVNGPMSLAASNIEMSGCDLILLDDSTNAGERAATIRAVSARQVDSTVVIIHDYETLEYQRAARAFTHRFKFDCLNPNTGVFWNNALIDKRELREMNKLIKQNLSHVPLSDVEGWGAVFAAR